MPLSLCCMKAFVMVELVSDSDFDSYTDTSESEDQNGNESTYGGHAKSILSSLEESLGNIDDFLTYERGFVHGDIVCSITDLSGQLGRVVDIVDMIVGLETTYGELIKEVNSKKLLRLRSFVSGDYVVHGPWLGRVDRVVDVVTVMFDDGTRSEIMAGDSELIVPISPILFEDAPYPYYPGQRVRIKLTTISESVRWLCGSSKTSQIEGTICHVEVGSVYVNWIASVMIDWGVTSSTPPCLQDPENLTLLSCFTHANWQLGEWCALPSDYCRSPCMTTKKTNSSTFDPRYHNMTQKKFNMNDQCHKHMYVIAKTKTKVDVLWQNGSMSLGIDSRILRPVNNVGEHEFWPGQFVLENVISEDAHVPSGRKWGFVSNVDAQERIVKVKWLTSENTLDDCCIEKFNEDIVSAYELFEHPDFSYCIGDVVFRSLPHFENLEQNILDGQTNGQNLKHDIRYRGVFNSSTLSGKDTLIKKSVDEGYAGQVTDYLSCIGNVIGFKNVAIEVRWANGHISEVHPSGIFGLNKLDHHPPAVPVIDEEDVPEIVTKEMADQEKQSLLEKEKVENDSGEDHKKYVCDASSLLLPWVAIGYLTNVATNIFNSRGFTYFSAPWKRDSELQILKAEELQPGIDDLQSYSLKLQEEEANMNEELALSPDTSIVKFKKFDIVGDFSDHHFMKSSIEGSSQVNRGWLKKVQQEWSILKKELPDTIFVRVYEERIDLLRACIVGAPGTPYHDGLFFFDFFFPPGYPQEPPFVHYNSGGLQLNPNLYESGKVCLSLLNTWVGTGTEVWNPESSTILQVLLSLQALVLNDKPYFNEAGYDEQVGRADGEKNSITYNENVFLLSCKSMLYILYRPPKHFEALVDEHFTKQSHHFLLACKAYVDGAQLGYPFEHGKLATYKSCSTGFKIMLAKLFPKMVAGFTERGIDCSQFLGQILTGKVPDFNLDTSKV